MISGWGSGRKRHAMQTFQDGEDAFGVGALGVGALGPTKASTSRRTLPIDNSAPASMQLARAMMLIRDLEAADRPSSRRLPQDTPTEQHNTGHDDSDRLSGVPAPGDRLRPGGYCTRPSES